MPESWRGKRSARSPTGTDPVVEKRAARDVLTFGALAKEYIDSHAKPNKRSWREDARQLNASGMFRLTQLVAARISSPSTAVALSAVVAYVTLRLPRTG
jgi:hypothetical protein